ncbi:hypothetical protein JIN84_00785 [Luteolibacter yonseiensis]|uniref:3-keto-disaccharide hydrolase domain-containing protein n=1 Tax=Luteolibacter yonseiensis TaxID=1144680 RepID=A0A934QWR2_9BACT|nr:hypothetical protein [Luteolibacter yonseiensis]MBK1814143.1 hypothetical protein [Luteolibacter yonseiensis]
MKARLTASFLGMTLLLAAEETVSTVRFANDDQLPGTLESLSPEALVWKSPILDKPASFFLKDVLELGLTPEHPEGTARHEASVSLTNGDILRGQLASVGDEVVELDTWFAGRMKLNRLMISDISISGRPDLLYRGPTGLDDWKQSGDKPAWNYQNGGFRSSAPGSIARDMKLPDECSISFDAAWRDSFSLDLNFFAGEPGSARSADGYVLTFRNRYLSLRSGRNPQNLGNSATAEALQENEKARIEVRASLKTGKVCIFVDGEIIDVWTDPDVAKLKVGRWLHFVSSSISPVQVSRIEIAAWDGEVEQMPDPKVGNGLLDEEEPDPLEAPPKEEKPKAGRMELRNGDSLDGEVLSITEGMISIKTPFREVKLPIEVLRSLALKPAELERCKRENGDVRGWFPDGSSVVFRLEEVKPGVLSGSSQNFGNADFKTAAFNRIEFNIYDPEYEELRAAEKW